MADSAATPTPAPASETTSTPSSSSTPSAPSSTTSRGRVMRKALRGASFADAASRLSLRSAAGQTTTAQDPNAAASAGFSGGGGAVPYQAEMEQRFGTSFADVRSHTGGAAAEACDSLGAQAYAVGNDVAFASASPDAATVAHELTHVVQQAGGRGTGPMPLAANGIESPSSPAEHEADAVEASVRSGGPMPEIGARPTGIARDPVPGTPRTQPAANAQSEVTAVGDAHTAELEQIVQNLRGGTGDGDVFAVLRILSHWDLGTITSSWIAIAQRHPDDDWLWDFCDNVGLTHFRQFPRECVGTFSALRAERKLEKAIDLTNTGFLNGVSDEEAMYAFILLRTMTPDQVQRFRDHAGGENWSELTRHLQRTDRDLLDQAINPDREAALRREEETRRTESTAERTALQNQETQGVLSRIRRNLESGIFNPVTDEEALHVLAEFVRIREDHAAVGAIVRSLELGGYIDRWIENLPDNVRSNRGEQMQAFLAVLRHRPPEHTLRFVNALLSTGLFDWAVTEREAQLAYYLIRAQPPSVQQGFRERDQGHWLERMETNLGVQFVTQADTGDGHGFGTASTEDERAAQDRADAALTGDTPRFEAFTALLTRLTSTMNQANATEAYTLLTAEPNVAIRQAMVRRMDAVQLVSGVLSQLGTRWIWAEERRRVTLTILAARDPMRSIAEIQSLMSVGLFDWAVTSDDAYMAFSLVRSLPEGYRHQFQQQNPDWWSRMEAEMNQSQRTSDDLNLYRGGEDGADRRSILAQVSDARTWSGTTPAAQQQLGNVCRMAIAAGHRREVHEAATANHGFEQHTALMTQLGLRAGPYVAAEIEGNNYWREGPLQWTAETASMVGQAVDALAQTEQITMAGDSLGVRGLELDEVQDITGGSLAGMRFRRTEGAEDDTVNTLDAHLNGNDGTLFVEAPDLQIEAIRYPYNDMVLQTGAMRIQGLVLDATWRTEARPDQNTTLVLRIRALDVRDITVILRDSQVAISHVQLQNLEVHAAELPVPADQLTGRPEQSRVILQNLQVQQTALMQLLDNVSGVRQGVTGTDFRGGIMNGPGGMQLSVGDLLVEGITTSGGAHVDSVHAENLQLDLEHLPSRYTAARITQLRRTIERNRARIATLDQQQSQGAQRTPEQRELDTHERERLTREIGEIEAQIPTLEQQIPAMQTSEARYLELYGIQRNGVLSPEQLDEFTRLQRSFHGGATFSAGSLEVAGVGTAPGQSMGTFRAEGIDGSGSTGAIGMSMMSSQTYAALGLSGAPHTAAGGPPVDQMELRAQRITATGAPGLESAELRGLRVGGGANGTQANGSVQVGELSASGIDAGGVHVGSVSGTDIGGSVTGALGMLSGQRDALQQGEVHAGSLHVRDATHTSSGTHVDSVDATDLRAGLDTTTGGGTASVHAGDLRVQGVSTAGGTAVQDVHLQGADLSASGLGNPLAAGWSPVDRDLSLNVHLDSLTVAGLDLIAGNKSIRAQRAALTGFDASVAVRVGQDAEQHYVLRAGSLSHLHIGRLEGTQLRAVVPVGGERVEIVVPTAAINGLDVRDVPLVGFDPLTMTGQLRLDSASLQLNASIGSYFRSHGHLSVSDLSLGAFENGDVRFHLGDLTLEQLGFSATDDVPPDSIVARLRGARGEVNRIGGLSADGGVNRQTGEITLDARLAAIQLSGVHWASEGRGLDLDGQVNVRDVSLGLRATIDPALMGRGRRSGDAVRSLVVDHLGIEQIEGTGIHFHDDARNLHVDLQRGYIDGIELSNFVLGPNTFNLNVRGAGLEGFQLGLQQALETGGQRIIQAHGTARVGGITVARANDGTTTFDIGGASLNGGANVQQTDAQGRVTRTDVSGTASLTGVNGTQGPDGLSANVAGGQLNGNVEHHGADGSTTNAHASGNFTGAHVDTRGGVSRAGVDDANIDVSGQTTDAQGHGGHFNFGLHGFNGDVTVTDTGLEATLGVRDLGLRNVDWSGQMTGKRLGIHIGNAGLVGVRARMQGAFTGTGANRTLSQLTVMELVVERVNVDDTIVHYDDVDITLPHGHLSGINLSGLRLDINAAGVSVAAGAQLGLQEASIQGLSARVGDSFSATGNVTATGLNVTTLGGNGFEASLDDIRATGLAATVDGSGRGFASLGASGITVRRTAAGTDITAGQVDFQTTATGTGDSVTIPGSAASTPTYQYRWQLPFMDNLNGNVMIMVPVNGSFASVGINCANGHLQPGASLAQLHLPWQEIFHVFLPEAAIVQLSAIVVGAIIDVVQPEFTRLRPYLEDMLNAPATSSAASAPMTIDVNEMSRRAVDGMGGASFLLDMAAPTGRGVIGTATDGLTGLLIRWDPLGLIDDDQEAEVARMHAEEVRRGREQAVRDWIRSIHLGIGVSASGGVHSDRHRLPTGAWENVLDANAAARLSGRGQVGTSIRLGAAVNVNNITANFGGTTVGVDQVTLNAGAQGGVDGQGTMTGDGSIRGGATGLRVHIPGGR